jgi:hypothetical protein
MRLGNPPPSRSWRPAQRKRRHWLIATLSVVATTVILTRGLSALDLPSFALFGGGDLEIADAMRRNDAATLRSFFSDSVMVNGLPQTREALVGCLLSSPARDSLFRQLDDTAFRTVGDEAITTGIDTFVAANGQPSACQLFTTNMSDLLTPGATYTFRYTHTWKRSDPWVVVTLDYAGLHPPFAPADPGSVSLTAKSVALGIGYSWGEGLLTLSDKSTYKFRVSNIKLGSIGFSTIHARGTVHNLAADNVADFNGTYLAGEAGLTLGGGASGISMVNEAGVVIRLRSLQSGVNLILGVGGVTIRLVD